MEAQSVESDVLRCFYSDTQEAIAHPGSVAATLYQEGVVAEGVVGEVKDRGLCSEKSATIMRAVGAAVKADPKKLWVLIAVLEKFAESAPVAKRIRDELRSRGLEGERTTDSFNNLLQKLTFNWFVLQLHNRN